MPNSPQHLDSEIEKAISQLQVGGLHPIEKREAIRNMATFGLEAQDALINTVLSNRHCNIRGNSAIALGKIRSQKALPVLIEALNGPDDYVAKCAAEALGALGTTEATEAMISALQRTSDDELRYIIIASFRRVNDPQIVEALLDSLHDESNWVREAVIFALKSLVTPVNPRVIHEIIDILDDESSYAVHFFATQFLMRIGSPAIEPLKENATSHPNPMVRSVAASIVRQIENSTQ